MVELISKFYTQEIHAVPPLNPPVHTVSLAPPLHLIVMETMTELYTFDHQSM